MGDLGSIPGSGRSPGEGNGNPLQDSCLENPMDWGVWWATVHGVAKSWTRLNEFTIYFSVSLVTQSSPTLCNPMNHSTPGLPVHHQLLEFPQSHVHRVSDAIQPSHPLSSPSPAPNPSQHQSFFQWVLFTWGGQSTGVSASASVLPTLVGSPCSPRDSQESSPTPQFKSINSSALSFLHSPTLTSIHDHRKNHSLD